LGVNQTFVSGQLHFLKEGISNATESFDPPKASIIFLHVIENIMTSIIIKKRIATTK
jgi:hypothetical protein